MKPSTNDQIKGTLHELKGKTKQQAGQLTNNPRLTADGQNEKLGGKIQKKIGQVEAVLEK
ncbi:MAG: CsbD family protein [Bryobacteraceae bacterium]